MLAKYPNKRNVIEFVSLEATAPEAHLLRKIDAAIDFDRIYDFVEDLYCEDNGRPSIDPVILFKIVLIQHIYGLPSLRRTLEEINMNMAYRWFLGIPINESIPHFSTVSHNFKHRFSQKTIEYVFRWILNTAAEEGYLDTEAVFVDGTHIKASANTKKKAKKMVPKQTKRYAKELLAEVNKDREAHGKKPFDDDDNEPPEEKEATISTTDPESGLFHKVVVADSAYKTPWICRRIFTSERVLSTAYTRPKEKKGGHPWHEYVYDSYYDDVICPSRI